jgi:hypothetical protein
MYAETAPIPPANNPEAARLTAAAALMIGAAQHAAQAAPAPRTSFQDFMSKPPL